MYSECVSFYVAPATHHSLQIISVTILQATQGQVNVS